MKPSDENPYSAPAAALDTELSTNARMQSLPRFSAWYVFGLSVITLGFYFTYWMFTRTNIINRVHDEKISMNLVYTVLGLLLANLIISFVSGMYPENADYQLLANLSSLAFSITSLFWAFTMRNRIHQMSHASNLNSYWMGGIMTFFFQALYMQYKINEYLDTHQSESSLAS